MGIDELEVFSGYVGSADVVHDLVLRRHTRREVEGLILEAWVWNAKGSDSHQFELGRRR